MKVRDIREFTTEELEQKISDLKVELRNLRFQQATNQLENPLRINHIKKDIARTKTVIRERELKIAEN